MTNLLDFGQVKDLIRYNLLGMLVAKCGFRVENHLHLINKSLLICIFFGFFFS